MSSLSIKERREHLRELQSLLENGDWRPPHGLSERSTTLWAELVPIRARSPERRQALEVALRALDRIDEIGASLDGADLVQKTRATGAHHLNPLLKAEKEARRDFTKLWRELGFDYRGSLDSEGMHEIRNPESVACGVFYGH